MIDLSERVMSDELEPFLSKAVLINIKYDKNRPNGESIVMGRYITCLSIEYGGLEPEFHKY